ncbi:MAG: AAA family ATPase [Methylophilaceae bacterium]
MYYPHFGLKEPPFKITPNTDFFYPGGNRGAVLDALVYAIVNGEGIIKVVGEVGSGKTMLCRMLQTVLPEKVESIYLAMPSVAPEDVLHAIAFELQLKLPKNTDRLKVMQILQAYLLKRHTEGKQVVIFVEEAQAMPIATLEEIRLLSNLETKQDKLLQIVLFGQPELDENLNQPHIRQLRERITHSFNLGPLQTKDVSEYLIFRLRAAGYFGPHLFTEGAVKKISNTAQGLVRRVNILAEKSLLAAYADNVHQVTVKHVKAAVQDSEFGKPNRLKQIFSSKSALLSLLGVILLMASLAYWWTLNHQVSTVNQQIAEANVLQNQAVAQQQSAIALADGKDATQLLLEKRLNVTQEWLRTSAPNTITLQIMTSVETPNINREINGLSRQLDINKLYLYRRKQNNITQIVFLYGEYAHRDEAMAAMQALPTLLKNKHPQLRTLLGINNELEQKQ